MIRAFQLEFSDEELASFRLTDIDSVYLLIAQYLCGEITQKGIDEPDRSLFTRLYNLIGTIGVGHAQFNEMLLMMERDRVSEGFFLFFFGPGKIKLEQLKHGVTKFRGYSLLCFGNFRAAYDTLRSKNCSEIQKYFEKYLRKEREIVRDYSERLRKGIEVDFIPRENTWFTGYISGQKFKKEKVVLDAVGKSELLSKTELSFLVRKYSEIGKQWQETQEKAVKNTDVYLTWDYMDVYVATSMRNKWEFEDTYDFVHEVFNSRLLKPLKLRYFDPTQFKCHDRIDKGLVEGLMLKRCRCTIYMAQESDTMGKDSELAATLAQGKPVIAYVPRIDVALHAKKIANHPLAYFKQRWLVLLAEEMPQDEECNKELHKIDDNPEKFVEDFVRKIDEYRQKVPFTLWAEREEIFKLRHSSFRKICKIFATVEKHSYNKRATLLAEQHPLGLQVQLGSGVANGVLVVRTAQDCSRLLYRILTNSLQFAIRRYRDSMRDGGTSLMEEISQCKFRVVTDYEKLSNSFWNFYLASD